MSDYIKLLDLKYLELSANLYESSFYFKDLKIKRDVLYIYNIKKSYQNDDPHYVLIVKPVRQVIWNIPHDALKKIIKKNHELVITNTRLIRNYIEDIKYSIFIEGIPSWSVSIKININEIPVIELVKQEKGGIYI